MCSIRNVELELLLVFTHMCGTGTRYDSAVHVGLLCLKKVAVLVYVIK